MSGIIFLGNCVDSYVDFGSPAGPFAFSSFGSHIGSTFIPKRSLDYLLGMVAGVPFSPNIKIDPNGNQIFSGYSVTFNNTPRIDKAFVRSVPGPGRNITTLIAYENDLEVARTTSSYVFLQQATPVTQTYDTVTNAIIGPLGGNSSANVAVGQIIGLDKSLTRGDEVSSTWVVLKYDPNTASTPQAAIPGVDYSLSTGSLSSDRIAIAFLNTNFNYTVQNTASGYTFSNNPYFNVPLDTTPNNNSSSHNFLLFTPTYTNVVLFPKLDTLMSVPANLQLATNPLTTYQNQPITVQAQVIGNTGTWILQAPAVPDLAVTKTDLEWQTEMTNRCTITLQIKDKALGTVLATRDGFGPYNISIQNINLYTLLYVTTLK